MRRAYRTRIVRQYAFWRGVRRAASRDEWRGLTGAVTILLYHAVTVPGERPTRFVVAGLAGTTVCHPPVW
jgi:hypothetical protein